MARSPRDDDRSRRVAVAAVMCAVAGLLAWEVTHHEPPRSERIAACAAGAGLPCAFRRADGTLMVRWRTPRGTEVITAAEFDAAYRDWREEPAPERCERGIGSMSAC